MKLFGRKDETALIVKEQPVMVAVPDIKEYLVNEYERVDKLRQKIEKLENELELARETKYKYDATLVTLDEYKKRLDHSESLLEKEKLKVKDAQNEVSNIKDELNSYKIIMHDAALTKEALIDDIVLEFKSNLVGKLNEVKGNLSKMTVAKIINETELHQTEKGGVE